MRVGSLLGDSSVDEEPYDAHGQTDQNHGDTETSHGTW